MKNKVIYWYAPKLRPPAFGGIPSTPKALPLLQKKYPSQRFHAWAYAAALPKDVVERFDLHLVEVCSGGQGL